MRRLNITLPDPATLQLSPHRYLYVGMENETELMLLADDMSAGASSKWRALLPYQKGEVVYVVHGDGFAKAYISEVLYEFRGGERKEMYRVHRLNANGKAFGKNWYYAHPGYIQRGYQRAGLAPEMPGEKP